MGDLPCGGPPPGSPRKRARPPFGWRMSRFGSPLRRSRLGVVGRVGAALWEWVLPFVYWVGFRWNVLQRSNLRRVRVRARLPLYTKAARRFIAGGVGAVRRVRCASPERPQIRLQQSSSGWGSSRMRSMAAFGWPARFGSTATGLGRSAPDSSAARRTWRSSWPPGPRIRASGARIDGDAARSSAYPPVLADIQAGGITSIQNGGPA